MVLMINGLIIEHIINRLSFGYVRVLQLEYDFSCFASFLVFFFFLFLLPLFTFKPLNALDSKLE